MKKSIVFAIFTTLVSSPVAAGPFDGLYHPAHMNSWSCRSDQVGRDGGAIAIQGDVLTSVEGSCRLTNPTVVRDMNAVLYDAACFVEGSEFNYRLMLLGHTQGVYMINNDGVFELERCR